MNKLPEYIYFNNIIYYLKEYGGEKRTRFDGWWFCGYWPNGNLNELPAETTDGKINYFLVSVHPNSKEAAESDLLERVNNMKHWLFKKR